MDVCVGHSGRRRNVRLLRCDRAEGEITPQTPGVVVAPRAHLQLVRLGTGASFRNVFLRLPDVRGSSHDLYGTTGILARHYLPLYVSLFLLGAWLFDRFLGIRLHGWRAAAKRVLACLVLVACLGHFGLWAKKGFDLTIQALESGFIGNTFNTVQWIESETIEYLRENPIDARVFCNRYGLLRGLLALKTRTGVRGKYPTLPKKLHRLMELIEAGRIEGGTYIVWLKSIEDPQYDFDDMDLRALPGVETVAELSDGVIFHVTGDAVQIATAPATTIPDSPRP